jgi:hypothetical protein
VKRPVIAENGRRSTYLSGNLGAIHKALKATGTPWMFCPIRRVPMVSNTRADDVLSHLEYAQRCPVELRLL